MNKQVKKNTTMSKETAQKPNGKQAEITTKKSFSHTPEKSPRNNHGKHEELEIEV